ncbi:hypothetical protein SO802_008790 [Lithocarpus litseifolius]|uniref:DUF4283 domain-containing protein n=1 Tax=Lithocarpus litseifolius TaxID=425828 RepID=A0AAW2DC73_9ROSI
MAPFWVQIHELPMRMQTREIAEMIAGPFGVVEKVDMGEKGFSMGKYLWVRITLDITQPLSQGRAIRMGGLKTGWVDFHYKRLLRQVRS